MLLADLIDTLQNPIAQIPSITYGTELNEALRMLERLMRKGKEGQQLRQGKPMPEEREAASRPLGPTTRSHKVEPIGTIIRKEFENNKYYEGEVTGYISKGKLCKIKHMRAYSYAGWPVRPISGDSGSKVKGTIRRSY